MCLVFWTGNEGVVISDWDADGAVSAGILLYLQNSGVFPVKGDVEVHVVPASAHEVERVFRDFNGCPSFYAFLDIPVTSSVLRVLEKVRSECPKTLLVYVDHHLSTLENLSRLRKLVDVVRVGKEKPTSLHLVDIAREHGKRLPDKLRAFAEAVGYIELGRKPQQRMMQIVEMMANISRALKLERDKSFWEKMVRWMANPLPIPLSKADLEVLERVKKEAHTRDVELEEAVTILAISAEKLGCFRFVDARKKWKRRGVTSLATRLSRKLKAPVALLSSLGNHDILVIRTRNNAAKLVGDELVAEQQAIDVGGHGNISVVRLRDNYDINVIKRILLRACRYAE